jgi:glycosyltransferase involved in cell wall biosynthesis
MTTTRRPQDDGPLVSVVLPTYNRAHTLPRAIGSVLSQSYRNLELIVVDDASKDDTAAVVGAIADPRIRYERLPKNGGASHARNAGMRLARGDLFAFQDSDDEWLADKLAKQVAAVQSAGEAAVTVFHTKVLYGRDAAGVYGPQRVCCLPLVDPAKEHDFRQLIHRSNLISPQALMFSRAAFEKAGFFDEDLVNNEDWALGIELFYNSKVVFLDEPLVMTYLQSDSISTLMRKGARAQLRVMQKLRKLPDIDMAVIGGHLGRLGWGIAKLGHRGLGQRLLLKSIRLQPRSPRNWARAVVNFALIMGQGKHRRVAAR